jgi:ZIP family zinc transporter
MDDDIEHSERRVETNFYQWRRRVTSVAVPKEGSKIQSSLIIPVVIDCIVDGFLLGVSVSLSLRAGVILALATSFEMCFLGMAVATRVRKCTASTKAHRLACIILPPFVITLGSLLGVSVGTAAYAFPVVLIAFVAFGIVALLHLVTTELLEEAMEHRDNIWVPASIFVGVFLVVLIDQVTPEGMDMQAQTMEHFTQ